MFNVTWANQWEPSKKYNMPLIVIIVIFQLEYISMKISLLISDEEMAKQEPI